MLVEKEFLRIKNLNNY